MVPECRGREAITVRLSFWASVVVTALLALACSPAAAPSPTAAPAKPTAPAGGAPAASPAAAASPGAAASPAAVAPSTASAPAAATKPTVAPDNAFYAGKTIRILVPFAPGGGQDLTARLFASRWGDYFPNKPNFIVENMPGAGGAVAMRDLIEKKAPDGLTLTVPGSGVALRWLLKEQGHNYPMNKMPAIGALPSGGVAVARADAGQPIEKLIGRDKPLRAGQNTAGALGSVADSLIMDMLGIPLDLIYGFEGYGEVAIAVERGEIEETTPGMPSYLQTYMPMVESKLIYPLFQTGQLNEKGEVVRSPLAPNLPTGYEEYKRTKGKEPAGEEWEAYKVLVGMTTLNGAVLTHPDIPGERLSALRESFIKMISDPTWGPETARVLGQPAPAVGGDPTEAAMQVMIKAPPSVVEVLAKAGR
jgi:tripartite-type tricarboxylate transporter receptor subunit TctC